MMIRVLLTTSALLFSTQTVAMTAPETTPEPSATVTPSPKPSPHRMKREIMPPPRKLPKPHNMEPPIAPLSEPQMKKQTPPTEPPVPGDSQVPDDSSN